MSSADAAAARHFQAMAEQAEAGHVRHAVHVRILRQRLADRLSSVVEAIISA